MEKKAEGGLNENRDQDLFVGNSFLLPPPPPFPVGQHSQNVNLHILPLSYFFFSLCRRWTPFPIIAEGRARMEP
jgi:hypothetical protein